MKQTNALSQRPSSRFWVWTLLFSLGAILCYGLISLPPLGDTNPTFHVASRYLDLGLDETGFSSSFFAVLLDYRSFNLVLFDLFFISVTLMALLFCAIENLFFRPSERLWAGISLFSSIALLVLGCAGLKGGSNFMDYEFWSGVFGPSTRSHGAWVTGALVLLTAVSSLIWIGKVWILGKEKRLGR